MWPAKPRGPRDRLSQRRPDIILAMAAENTVPRPEPVAACAVREAYSRTPVSGGRPRVPRRIPAGPRPGDPCPGIPTPRKQDPGLFPPLLGPFPQPAHAYAGGGADLPHRGASARAQLRPHRDAGAGSRPGTPTVRPRRRARVGPDHALAWRALRSQSSGPADCRAIRGALCGPPGLELDLRGAGGIGEALASVQRGGASGTGGI